MKRVLVFLLACLSGTIMYAQTQQTHYTIDWTGCEGMNTKIIGVLTIDDVEVYNGEGMHDAGGGQLEIGVFDQDDICRGTKFPTWRAKSNQWIYQLQFRGVQGYSVYHFKVYDHATETEMDLVDNFGEEITYQGNYTYQWNGSNSSATNPYHINFTNPGGASSLTLEIDPYTGEKDNYYLIAAPFGAVNASAVEGLNTPNFDFYSFDQAAADGDEWINLRNGVEEFQLQAGVGYLYANNSGTDLTFTGQPLNEDSREIPLAYSTETVYWQGWNLVGNPYEVPVYPDRPFYTMNEAGAGFVGHDANEALPAMSGAFVCATEAGQNVVMSKTAQNKASRLSLNLSNSRGVVDRAIVGFGEGQQLSKLMFRENSTKVYIPVNGTDYAVVRSEGMGELPVNFKAEKSGSYTIIAKGEEVSFTYLHLIDNMTGADVDLLTTPSYSFDASTTDYESRFRLVFATGSSVDGDTFGFINGAGNLSIYGIEGEATLQVMDVNGRVLSTETFSGSYEKSLNVAAGIYMLRLTNGDNVRVQKMVIR